MTRVDRIICFAVATLLVFAGFTAIVEEHWTDFFVVIALFGATITVVAIVGGD